MSVHNHYGQVWDCHSIDKRLKTIESNREYIRRLLATERDAFGKRETELMKDRDEWKNKAEVLQRSIAKINGLLKLFNIDPNHAKKQDDMIKALERDRLGFKNDAWKYKVIAEKLADTLSRIAGHVRITYKDNQIKSALAEFKKRRNEL